MRLTLMAAAVCLAGGSCALGQIVQNGGVTGTSPTVSTLTTGTVLNVKGVSVSADRRYVTLNVQVSSSTLEGMDTYRVGNVRVGVPRPFRTPLGAVQANAQAVLGMEGERAPAMSEAGDLGRVVAVAGKGSEEGKEEKPAKARIYVAEFDRSMLGAAVPALKTEGAERLTLRQAVSRIARESKKNIVLGTAALKNAGIDEKAMYAFDVPAGTVRDQLKAVLRVGAPGQGMVVLAEENVIFVTTQAQADKQLASRTYYLADLAHNSPQWLNLDLDDDTRKALKAGEEGKVIDASDQVAPRKANKQDVMELMVRVLRPEIWKVNGGNGAEFFVVDESVTIKAPKYVHALLDGPKVHNPNQAPLYIHYGTR